MFWLAGRVLHEKFSGGPGAPILTTTQRSLGRTLDSIGLSALDYFLMTIRSSSLPVLLDLDKSCPHYRLQQVIVTVFLLHNLAVSAYQTLSKPGQKLLPLRYPTATCSHLWMPDFTYYVCKTTDEATPTFRLDRDPNHLNRWFGFITIRSR